MDSRLLRALARQRLGFCLLLAGTNMTVLAQDDSELRSGPVVIPATRTPELADQSLAAVTVVDSREIARRKAHAPHEPVRDEAGIARHHIEALGTGS